MVNKHRFTYMFIMGLLIVVLGLTACGGTSDTATPATATQAVPPAATRVRLPRQLLWKTCPVQALRPRRRKRHRLMPLRPPQEAARALPCRPPSASGGWT